LSYWIPLGRIPFASRAAESAFYGLLMFSPVFCAGLIFSASFKHSPAAPADFGANLLGAMAGGIREYLALVGGYQFLLVLVGACYLAAVCQLRMADFGFQPDPQSAFRIPQ